VGYYNFVTTAGTEIDVLELRIRRDAGDATWLVEGRTTRRLDTLDQVVEHLRDELARVEEQAKRRTRLAEGAPASR
jgi:hypothetical protein